jgi:TM2 domain-containing membrane protein YozV
LFFFALPFCASRFNFFLIVCCWAIFPTFLSAQDEFSLELTMRDYVPQIYGDIAKDSGSGYYLVKQAALWRRDIFGFPGLANSLAVEALWHHDKISWGGGYEFGSDLYSVDSSLATNALALSPIDFSGWAIDHLLFGKFLLHLKHNYQDGIFVGARAGVVIYQAGLKNSSAGDLALAAPQAKSISAYPMTGISFGLYGGVIVGLRFFILSKVFSVIKPGFRVFVEYGVSTDSGVMQLGKFGDKIKLNYGGLTANLNLFISLPRTPKKNLNDD